MSFVQLVRRFYLLVVILIALNVWQGTPDAVLGAGTTFTVTKTEDTNDGACDSDCSLREAILAANANPGVDTIVLAATTYNMTIPGIGEDVAATGDFDIIGDLEILGAGTTVIDALSNDRIFHVHSGNVLIRGVTLQNGSGDGAGGAILSAAGTTLTVEDSDFLENSANNGGGIYTLGQTIVRRSTFRYNSAFSDDGGAVFVASSATLAMTNSTLSHNTAAGYGGGVVMSASGTPQATIVNSTIAANTAGKAGGAGGVSNNWAGTLVLQNTIVAYNKVGGTDRNCSGTITNGGNNLQYPGTTCGGFTTADPLLQIELQENGGPTLTRAPQRGSPALDAGNNTVCPATDQRGVDRPQDGDGNGVPVCDIGAVELQPHPVVLRAVSGGSTSILIQGRIHSTAVATFTLDFYASATCDPVGVGATHLGSTTATTDALGDAGFSVSFPNGVPWDHVVSATATDPNGNTSAFSPCTTVGPDNDVWTRAQNLDPLFDDNPLAPSAVVDDQTLNQPAQSRWYKFTVQPGSRAVVSLSNLPANYDVALFADIAASFQALDSPVDRDLVRLGAEFAPDYFSPDYFSPDYFSPDYFSPDYFSPDYFSPDYFSPDYFSPDYFSPDYFSPDYFSPDYFSPDYFSPELYTAATRRSLLAVSAQDGTTHEFLDVNTWNHTGTWYIRVYGRNGVHSLSAPFHLQVTQLTGACSQVSPVVPPENQTNPIGASAGGYRTIVLADRMRMPGTAQEKQALWDKLQAFAARSEVAGLVLDVGTDGRIAYLNAQADDNHGCPFAKNLVAEALREIIRDVRDLNPALAYVVLVGNDDTIPFFRHPDTALLANEADYVPPVLEETASNASLRLGYVLGQDAYGAQLDVSLKSSELPIPDLAVGRLVETPAEIMAVLDAYLSTSNGVVPTPQTGLVTGYEFMVDAAEAFGSELAAGLGAAPDALLPSGATPTWTADELRAALLGSRHDLVFLAGHFSAANALAADYETRLAAQEVARSSVNLANSIIVGMGCHAGYNTVDAHGIPQVTEQPDWAQAFAGKGATLIAGTGYQYGDTDFLAHSELLYVELSKQFRYGSGPVPVGRALVGAKKAFLASHPDMRGISQKAYLIATLFGLPMLSVDMPHGRIPAPTKAPLVSTVDPIAGDPGATLGLTAADVTVTTPATLHTKDVHDTFLDVPVTASYLAGTDGVVSNPAEPVLPLQWENVSVAGTALRGVLFLGGSYVDLPGVRPLTGSPTTEGDAIQAPFFTDFFYPVLPWRINYLDALSGGVTRLVLTPAQFRSGGPDQPAGTLRRFDDMRFRLYYSNNTGTYGDNTPALAAPPVLSDVATEAGADALTFRVRVQGDPAAGIQAVFATYTAVSGPLAGRWQSLPLQQNPLDSTLWEGTLALGGTSPTAIRYFLQAVNGVGLVGIDTNRGAHYTPGSEGASPPPGVTPAATQIVLDAGNVPAGAYNTQQTFRATLLQASDGAPMAGQTLRFRLGSLQLQATTGADGVATVNATLLLDPGVYALQVSFAGSETHGASSADQPFEVSKRETVLTLSTNSGTGQYSDLTDVVATLREADGAALGERAVFFVLQHSDGHTFGLPAITDLDGEASLPAFGPAGTYGVTVYFSGQVPLPTGTITLSDRFYQSSSASGTLTVSAEEATVTYTGETVIAAGSTLDLNASVAQVADGASGDLTRASVNYAVWQETTLIRETVAPVSADGAAPAAIAGLATGVYEIRASVTGGYYTAAPATALAAVFDPTAGHVTGGGWISSPPGAYVADPTATGKAHLNLVARYHKGTLAPASNIQFRLNAENFRFHATSYDWLVVAGARAKIQGAGTLSGNGNYGFMLTIVDGNAKAHDNYRVDGFRIKIWDTENGDAVVYDNQMTAGDDAYDTTALGGGSIVIHKSRGAKTADDEMAGPAMQLYLPAITNE